MSRKKIAAANWKMNTTLSEGQALLTDLLAHDLDQGTDVVICAPFTHLATLAAQTESLDNVSIGAQNMSQHDKGAYTGETSADMLLAVGVSHVVIGHSERREYFHESDELLGQKLRQAIDKGLVPIFCCGEGLDIRKAGTHVDHVITQLKTSFASFTAEDLSTLVIAYEPIWAIGTGETATPAQAQEMQAAIRTYLVERFGADMAAATPILYGGSVKPDNAQEIFSQPDVDGGLVGGASLKADSFSAIINSFS